MTNIQAGDIVMYSGEDPQHKTNLAGRRVVVDIADYSEAEDGGEQGVFAVLRRTDDDPQREVDAEGGDIHLVAVPVETLDVVGHI
jgi:hypothetical protein